MPRFVGVHFQSGGKMYHFLAGDLNIKNGDYVITETAHGLEFGQAVTDAASFSEGGDINPTRSVLRLATPEDIKTNEDNIKKEADAFRICEEKIAAHKLEMKLVEVSNTFDGSKIIFFFTADGRVDFRELVKDLAATFRTRIELRQIGVRDEAKMIGGFGVCGKPFCCTTFMSDFMPVSIKMAKEQGLSMNPAKISGACGRLMCCLKYEQAAYEDLHRNTPRQGALVETPEGRGVVVSAKLLTGQVLVSLSKQKDSQPREFKASQLKIIKQGDNGRGESIPKELEGLE